LTDAQLKKIGLTRFDPSEELSDPEGILDAFVSCLEEGEHEEAQQLLAAGLKYMNKSRLSKRYGIPRRTLYNLMDANRSPTLESVAKVWHALKQESLLAAKAA
jgi:probable addiction module antidote protein